MTDGEAIYIAGQYGSFDTFDDQDTGFHVSKWVFSEEELLDFVQAVIREERERIMLIDGSLSKIGTKSDIKFNSNGNERMSIDGHLRSLGTESPATKLTVNTEDLPAGIFSASDIAHDFVFHSQDSTEILRLDKGGMIFMGERITDAGEAYDAWMKAMSMIQGK